MIEQTADKLFELLSPTIPCGWERLAMHAIIEEKHYAITFYVKVNGKYYQCYELFKQFGVSISEANALFEKIFQTVISHKRDWYGFSLIVKNDGNFEVIYDYEEEFDLDEWEHEYLV